MVQEGHNLYENSLILTQAAIRAQKKGNNLKNSYTPIANLVLIKQISPYSF